MIVVDFSKGVIAAIPNLVLAATITPAAPELGCLDRETVIRLGAGVVDPSPGRDGYRGRLPQHLSA
jgi:hypothetical protein